MFVDKMLKGEIIIENTGVHTIFDEFLLNNWMRDLTTREGHVATLLEMRARLLRMADRILTDRESEQVQIHSRDISQVEQIAMYIAQNYAQPIKTTDIGKEVGLHPDYANVVFKKTFGMTLNEYVIQERISHAQRKLVSSDKNITDILYECGFNSISSFNAAFRKINKCTPREFRKKYH
jgi:AraC-like DNA-binding protein